MSNETKNNYRILDSLRDVYGLSEVEPNSLSPLTLAFIGDSVYDMLVKSVVVLSGNCPANELNKKAVKYVKAVSQAKFYDSIVESDVLDEVERSILRRGRNAKSPTVAKHASVGEYRKATGVEALVGYLYLAGENERLLEIMKMCMDSIDVG